MTLTPRGSVVFAKDITTIPEKTDSGLYVANLGLARPVVALVEQTGEKCRVVKPGDKVLVAKHVPEALEGDRIMFHEQQISVIFEKVET